MFEAEQVRVHPLSRASSMGVSVLDDEQARFQLQHDPAVAAMGPSHPVGEANSIASFGNMIEEERGVLPFHDRYASHHHHQHHHHHHQHLGLQVPPPPPFDVPFPRPPPPEHLLSVPLDPLLPPVHNQFLRPYPYSRLPLLDHNMYLRVPPPSFPHTGLLTPSRLQETSSSLSHPTLDQLKSFSNGGSTNGQSVASLRMPVPVHRSTTDVGPLPLSEESLAPQKSQFYTQFGSIGVEIPHESSSKGETSPGGLPGISLFEQPSSMNKQKKVGPAPLAPRGVVGQSLTLVDSVSEDRQHRSSIAEASREAVAISGAHAYQKRVSEPTGAEGCTTMYKEDVEKKSERHTFPTNRVLATTAPISTASHGSNNGSVELMDENGCETRTRSNKPQKAVDAMRKGRSRSELGHWVPVMKDRGEEATVNRTEFAVTPEDATNKTTHDARRQSGSTQGWRSKPTSGVLAVEPKRVDRLTKTKVPLQRDPLGLPSGTKVDSAPSSATEQSKQALQVSPATGAVESRMMEGSVDPLKAAVDSKYERDEENGVSSLSLSELDIENEVEQEAAKNLKHSPSEGLNLDVKDFDTRAARPARFNRRESFHRLDAAKCTNNFLSIFQTLIPATDEEQRRKQLLATLDGLVSGIWPEARLYLFGSCANAFGVCNSDIDVCLSIEGESAIRSEVVCTLADALKANHMQNVKALTHARVPIVKYSDPETGISCDVCVNNMLAVVNTKLLHDYAQIDVRLRQLAFMVKHWAKCRQVNETYRGTLSSYAYVLMCIHFLQQRKPPVLPCLQEMEPSYMVTVGDIKCAYFDRVEKLNGFGQKNKETLADLVTSFFDYWAFRHDYTRTVISIRTGKFLSKAEKDWTRRIGNERHLICIEDPFEVSHDLGRVVDKHSIRVLRDEFQRAARIMRQDVNPCVALFEPYIRQKAQAA